MQNFQSHAQGLAGCTNTFETPGNRYLAKTLADQGGLPLQPKLVPRCSAHFDANTKHQRPVVDPLDEMLKQSIDQPLLMGIALHPYLMGQPYRLLQQRRALQQISAAHDREAIWFTTPGEIHRHVRAV